MYVTRSFNKRAIQCYVPRPVWPALTSDLRRLALLDAAIASSDEADVADAIGTIAMARADAGTKMPGIGSALRYLGEAPALTSSTARVVNSHVVESSKAGFRPGFIWTGGNSAAETWHAGSPTEQLPALMNGLFAGLGKPGWPVSAAALIKARSDYKDREYGALIYRDAGGTIRMSALVQGTPTSTTFNFAALGIARSQVVGVVHNHPTNVYDGSPQEAQINLNPSSNDWASAGASVGCSSGGIRFSLQTYSASRVPDGGDLADGYAYVYVYLHAGAKQLSRQ